MARNPPIATPFFKASRPNSLSQPIVLPFGPGYRHLARSGIRPIEGVNVQGDDVGTGNGLGDADR
jgi:hypothetical protein